MKKRISWTEALADLMWPGGEMREKIALAQQVYSGRDSRIPFDGEDKLASFMMKMLEGCEKRLISTDPGDDGDRFTVATIEDPLPPPLMSLRDAQWLLRRLLEQGDKTGWRSEGSRSSGQSFEPIPPHQWRDSEIRPDGDVFHLFIVSDDMPTFRALAVIPGSAQTLDSFAALMATDEAPIAWTADRMMAEIAACTEKNREKAWKNHFKHRRAEHGWDVNAFRRIWSDARGTRGISGRIPSQR